MRELAEGERRVVAHLLRLAGRSEDVATLRVTAMDDGGMGSLRFEPTSEVQQFGGEVATAEVADADGVPVLFSLIIDQHGELFELDSWRVDFAPLQRWPTEEELVQATST